MKWKRAALAGVAGLAAVAAVAWWSRSHEVPLVSRLWRPAGLYPNSVVVAAKNVGGKLRVVVPGGKREWDSGGKHYVFKVSPVPRIYVPAYRAQLSGTMVPGTEYAAGADLDPGRDSRNPILVHDSSTSNDFGGTEDSGSAVFQLDVPKAGQYYLWGRFYCPDPPGSNGGNSFWVSIDTSPSRLKFGNSLEHFRRWHWAGDGAAETGPPRGLSIGSLGVGSHLVVIRRREVLPNAPRLDELFLTTDPVGVPTER